jgi:formylglycine-generating enzyme required for sulfatase activity
VLRGGSWYNDESAARVAARDHNRPGIFFSYFGLRVLVAPVF